MKNRRDFLKLLPFAATLTAIPSLGLPKDEQTKPGVLFVDVNAVDICSLCENGQLAGTSLAGATVIGVIPRQGMSVRDSICSSHDMPELRILERKANGE